MKQILIFSFFFFLTGCTTEYNLATKKEEFILYGTEKEVKIGTKVASKFEEQFPVLNDVDINERVQRIFKKIVAVSDRQDIVYFIKVIDKDYINAISLPGGYVYVFKGLIDRTDTDDQLASVIAHEVGHIAARHGIKRLQSSYGAVLLQLASAQTGAGGGVNLALTSLFMEYSQKAEFEADKLSIKYLKKAGYDPNGAIEFFEKLKKEKEKAPIRQYSYWKTHPHVAERIAVVNQEINGELSFRDYLNLIGDDDDRY